jgi:hypothetical protein
MDRLGSLLMLQRSSCIIALAVMGLSPAQAADNVLTLACQGTITETVDSAKSSDDKPEPVSTGIVLNFANRTVQGFFDPGGGLFGLDEYYPVTITSWDDAIVSFKGSSSGKTSSIDGTIDRVTGALSALRLLSSTNKLISALKYELKCRPAQRMF